MGERQVFHNEGTAIRLQARSVAQSPRPLQTLLPNTNRRGRQELKMGAQVQIKLVEWMIFSIDSLILANYTPEQN
jgi:hypothetical protein